MNKYTEIRDSIFQVWYDAFGFLGGSGTGFIISMDHKFYFVTASHCINDNYNDLCITNLLHNVHKKLPFSKIIQFDPKEDDRLDICFVEIDLNRILNDIEQNNDLNVHYLCNVLLLDPIIARIIRRSWSIKTRMKHVRKTTAYISQNKEILTKLNCLPDSDIHTKSLKFITNINFKENDNFYFIGYPDELQSIDYNTNKVHSQIIGIECKYIKTSTNSRLHELNVIDDNIINYRGFSGSPVFYKNDVCGIIVRAGNKKAHFIDFGYAIELLQKYK